MRRLLTLPVQFLIFSALLAFHANVWAAADWIDASVGDSHTIALKSDGRVFASGLNSGGQLGDGSTTLSKLFKQVATGVSDVAAYGNVSYILKNDGTVWKTTTAGGWTQTISGVASLKENFGGVNAIKADGSTWNASTGVQQTISSQAITSYVSSNPYTLGTKSDGTLVGTLSGLSGVSSVDLSAYRSCSYYTTYYHNTVQALKSDGTLWVYGLQSNTMGLGVDQVNLSYCATATYDSWTQSLDNVRSVQGSSSLYQTFAIKNNNTLWVTGSNTNGNLGNGTTTSINTWAQVATGVTTAIPGQHSALVKSDGTLWVTGKGAYGELGFNNTLDLASWTQTGVMGKLSVTKGTYSNKIALTWDNGDEMSSGSSFEVWRSRGKDGTKTLLATVSTSSYDDTSAVEGTVYGYYIKFSNGTMTDSEYGYRAPPAFSTSQTGNWIDASVGFSHTIALKNDGRVYSTGLNSAGQLGDGTTAQSVAFKQVITGVSDVAAFGNESYILKTDGTVWKTTTAGGWMQTISGVASLKENFGGVNAIKADGSTWNASTGVQQTISSQALTSYVSSNPYTLGTKSDGTLVGTLSGLSGVSSVDLSAYRSCSYYTTYYHNTAQALKSDGTLWVYGLQSNTMGLGIDQVNLSYCATATYDSWTQSLDNVRSVQGTSTDAYVGANHAFAIQNDGSFWVTGTNSSGNLGTGSTINLNYWQRIASGVVVAVPGKHSVIVKSDGTLWVTGNNDNQQLGFGDTTTRTSWTQTGIIGDLVATKGTVNGSVDLTWTSDSNLNPTYEIWRSNGLNGTKTKIATATSTTYSDTTATQGVTYGYHIQTASGQKTNNDYGYRTPVTTAISGSGNYSKVSVGQAYSLALKSDGTLFAAGRNDSGYLGDGTATQSKVFKLVLTGVQDILATSAAAYALKTDGTMWAAGPSYGNAWIQILSGVSAINTDYNKNTVWAIKGGTAYTGSNSSNWAATTYTGIKQITNGGGSMFWLKTDGTVNTNLSGYTASPIGTGFKAIVGANSYACPYGCYTYPGLIGIANDNSLWVWGSLSYDGTGASSSGYSWRKVLDSVADVKSIRSPSGTNIVMATKTDGTLWVTGSDAKGFFGDGTTSTYSYWKQVFDNVASVDIGVEDSIALRANGTAWITGTNSYGQQGFSDTTARTTWSQIIAQSTLSVSKGVYADKTALTWTNPDNVSEFQIYRSTGLNGSKSLLTTVTGTTYNDSSASTGIVYGYYVKPVGAGGASNSDYGYRTPVTTTITGSGSYAKISSGDAHSLALKSDGRLFAAGLNSSGQLGDGTTITSGVFKQVLTGVQDILAGTAVSFALKTDGSLWVAGSAYTTSWQQILTGVSAISTNSNKTKYWAIVSGTVYTGTTAANWAATTYSSVKQVFVGTTGGGGMGGSSYTDYTITLRTDGSVYVDSSLVGIGFKKIASTGSYWSGSYSGGSNYAIVGIKNDNSLWLLYAAKADGTGAASGTNSWVQIFDGVSDIDAHLTNYALFVTKTDGSLWATSYAQPGIFGDGTSTPTAYWKQVFDNATTVSAGSNHTLALRTNGTIWVTGANASKQHGLNDTTTRITWTQTGFIQPAKVTGVNATDGTLYSKVTVTWTVDPDATQYDVFRSTAAGTKGSAIATNVTALTYDDTTVSGNTHYFYTVVAKNPVGAGPDSDQNEGYGKFPEVLSNLNATQGSQTGKVVLGWISNPDATSYEVWRSATAGGTATKVATLTAMPASAYEDTAVSGVLSYFYTVKTVVGSLTSGASNEVEGWSNGAPTAASAALTASSTAPSAATSASITDPNVTAGKAENYTLTITTPPSTGNLAVVGGKFVYTPPADGLFSGPLSFEFTATDKGGSVITGTGSVNVVCGSPTIPTFTLPLTSVTQASSFQANATYSLPVCSTNGQVKVDVIDSNSVVVVAGTPIAMPNGAGQAHTFTSQGIITASSYTVRMTATSDSGTATKTAALSVKAVNLPTLSVSPGLSVMVGEELVTATVSDPATVNCPFTNDPAVATADPGKCYITLNSPPSGMTVDNSGTLPSMAGVIDTAGSYPIIAEVFKHDGTALQKIGQVSKTVTASCVAPAVISFDIPALLPYEAPNYASTYKAYSCNGALSGSITIKKNTTTIETLPLSALGYGASASLTKAGTGLATGNYTAELSIVGSFGTGAKTQSFQVKAAPMPTLLASPTTASQGETRVDVALVPSTDPSCPLTTVQVEAEADPKQCYVALTTTVPDMTAGTDTSGLPTLVGYPATVGDYAVQAVVSRWVNGTRYDSDPLIKNVKVTPVVAPVFGFSGDTDLYVGIEKASLIFKQSSGTTCNLYTDQATAQSEAAKGKRACFVNFTGDSGLTKTLSLNQFKLEGSLSTVGIQTIGYTVKRQFADGLTADLQTGEVPVTVNDLPPPTVTLKGGYKISEGKYYVPLGQAITRATITAGVPTNAKMKITINDSQQSFERGGVMSGGSYWISTPSLSLLEERPVTLRVAWQDFPQVFSEQIITAVGGTENNMKLVIDAPLQIADTEMIQVKVNVGKYTKTGVNYTPETMGQWRVQILGQTNTQTIKTPITDMKDAVNGEATFQINPAGNLFMKLTAVAELVSTVEGLDTSLTSSTRYVEVVKGSPIQGAISAKTLDSPAPKTFTLNLDMTLDNRVALKEVSWEESGDGGTTWTAIEKSDTIRHNIPMQAPGKRQARAKMINKNTQVGSYTSPVEVWAYAMLDAQIAGPRHVAPGHPITLAAQLYREGVLTTNTVNEWTIEAPSGTTNQTGQTITMTEEMEGKVYVTLRSRPADTRADDPYAWSATRSYVVIATPFRPSIYAKGPRDIETGKTYNYVGTVRPSWGTMESVHSTASEWQLPDGSTVSGETLDWSPTLQDLTDKKPLIFRSWVNGFKDTTTSETTVTYVPWQYVWPNWSVTLKQLTIQAPSDLILLVNHDRPDMNRRFEGLTYEWSFPAGVTGRQNEAFPNRAMAQALYAGEYDIQVTIRDSRGNQTVLTQPVTAEASMPYNVTLKVGKSNTFDRVPMTITVRPTIYGGHPLDSVIAQSWNVDGVPVDDFANRSFMVKDISDAGNHTLSYTLNSKMGETSTVNAPLFLVANQLPICELTAKPNAYVVYAEAKCTDPDGKVIGYSWQVNDQPIGSTSYRISFNKTGTPQTAQVTITAMDDAKESSNPVSIHIDY